MIVYTVMYMVHLSAAHSCDSRAPNLVMFFVCTLWVKKTQTGYIFKYLQQIWPGVDKFWYRNHPVMFIYQYLLVCREPAYVFRDNWSSDVIVPSRSMC